MHNFKTNFDKFLRITKSALKDYLLPDGNFKHYHHLPHFSDIEVVTLAITAEVLGIDTEKLLFSKLKKDYSKDSPTLPHRCNFNRRRKKLNAYIALIGGNLAHTNMKTRTSQWNPTYRSVRKRIETLFSQLCDQFMLKRNYAKSLDGLLTRTCSKISSVAALQYLNFKKQQTPEPN